VLLACRRQQQIPTACSTPARLDSYRLVNPFVGRFTAGWVANSPYDRQLVMSASQKAAGNGEAMWPFQSPRIVEGVLSFGSSS